MRLPLLLALVPLALSACSTTSKKGVQGPETFQFKRVIQFSGGTVDRVTASANVAGETFYAFLTNEGSAHHLYWIMEVSPGDGTTAPQRLDTDFTIADPATIQVQAAQAGDRSVIFTIRTETALYAAAVKILPSTQPQYQISSLLPLQTLTGGATIGDVALGALPTLDTASVFWVSNDAPAADLSGELHQVSIGAITSGHPAVATVYTTPSVSFTTGAGLEINGNTSWAGHIFDAFINTANAALVVVDGRPTDLSPLNQIPHVLKLGSTGASEVASTDFFTPARIGQQFTPPPTVEPCGNNVLSDTDQWFLTPKNGGRAVVTTHHELEYNCPTDPSQTLNDSTIWVVCGTNGTATLQYTQRPLVLADSFGRIFVFDPTKNLVTARNGKSLGTLGTIGFAATAPVGLILDAFTGVGTERYGSIRLVGHLDNTIYVADRSITDPQG